MLLDRAKLMRSEQTEAEQRLWYHLRARRFLGLKFKRQKPVWNYIVDFVCLSPKLIIEVDGGQHSIQMEYDARRNQWLRNEGFIVLRFWNNEVLGDTQAVMESIRETILSLIQTRPNPKHADSEKLKRPSPPPPLPLSGRGEA